MARLVPLMAVLLALAPDAIAQSKAIGRYNDWRVYTEGEGRNMVCFAAVEASDMAPKAADHGEVTFYVAAFKSGAATSQPAVLPAGPKSPSAAQRCGTTPGLPSTKYLRNTSLVSLQTLVSTKKRAKCVREISAGLLTYCNAPS